MKKPGRIIYGIVILLLCSAIAICTLRWEAWFGNPVEPAYCATQFPTHILLTMGNDASSRFVTWQCDSVVREAHIEYYRLDSLTAHHDTLLDVEAIGETFRSQGGISAFYRAELPCLATGHYFYRICHKGLPPTEWYSFVVNDMTDSVFSFIYIGDIQDSIGGITGQMTQQIVARHPESEFFVLGGDLIHRPHEVYWDEAFAGIEAFATSHTTLAVTGNHEYIKGLFQKSEQRFPLHFAYFLDNYHREGSCYYSIRYDNAELYFIDSNSDLPALIKQRNQLKEALSQSTAQWKIAVMHHPPYSIRRKSNNLHQRRLFAPLFEQYGVQLVMAGHEHGYARIHPNNNLPIYTISHCSPKEYRHKNRDIAVCYGNGNRYYQHIAIDGDTLQATTFTTDGDCYDTVTIVHNNSTFKIE